MLVRASRFVKVGNAVAVIIVVKIVGNAVIVVVKLPRQWIAVILLPPIGKAVCVIICIRSIPCPIVIMVIAISAKDTTRFINIQNIVVVVVRVYSIVEAVIVVVAARV